MRKNGTIVLLALFLAAVLTFELKGDEPDQRSLYVDRIQKTAEIMDVFPVDLIAREGPISCFEKGSWIPGVGIRNELNSESFRLFYDFCQLALDATPEDINECVNYLPQASAKEKALILTVFYVYAYPWERQGMVNNSSEKSEAIKTRSWFSLLFPCEVFDLRVRKEYQRNSEDSEKLSKIVAQFAENDEIAFQAVKVKEGYESDNMANMRLKLKETRDICRKLKTGADDPYLRIELRKELVNGIRWKYLNSSTKIISDLLYVTYTSDTFDLARSGLVPKLGNASEKPKTLGQIAQELLESWDSSQTPDDEGTKAGTDIVDQETQTVLDF